MKKMTKKELEVRNKCRNICNCNNKEQSEKLIKKEFSGCAVTVDMQYGGQGLKMYMGMIMWENISVSF